MQEKDIEPLVRRIAARYVPAGELDGLMAWLFKGPRVVLQITPVHIVKIGADWHTE